MTARAATLVLTMLLLGFQSSVGLAQVKQPVTNPEGMERTRTPSGTGAAPKSGEIEEDNLGPGGDENGDEDEGDTDTAPTAAPIDGRRKVTPRADDGTPLPTPVGADRGALDAAPPLFPLEPANAGE